MRLIHIRYDPMNQTTSIVKFPIGFNPTKIPVTKHTGRSESDRMELNSTTIPQPELVGISLVLSN